MKKVKKKKVLLLLKTKIYYTIIFKLPIDMSIVAQIYTYCTFILKFHVTNF